MKSILGPVALGGVLLLLSIGAADAQTYSLAQLLTGQTFTIPTSAGNSLILTNFSNGGIPNLARQPGQLVPPPAQIFATAINVGAADPGLLWQSAQWSVDPTQFLDTTWTYDVMTSDGSSSITGAGMDLGSYASQSGAYIRITGSLTNNNDLNLGSLLNDPGAAITQDNITFPAVSFVHAAKDVSMRANTDGDASLNTFTQTFTVTGTVAATPEPGSWAMLIGIGVTGGLWRFRRSRRHRKQADAPRPAP